MAGLVSTRRRRSSGFCRAEFLILLGVGVMVAGIAVPLWAVAIAGARVGMVEDDTLALVEAMERYAAEHDSLPLPVKVSFGDARFGDARYGNRLVLNILRGVDGPGNHRHAHNPEQTVYIEVAPFGPHLSGLNSRGEFLDAWGKPYQIVMDTDGDGECSVRRSRYLKIEETVFGVWSLGPDQEPDTPDDIRSWSLLQKR